MAVQDRCPRGNRDRLAADPGKDRAAPRGLRLGVRRERIAAEGDTLDVREHTQIVGPHRPHGRVAGIGLGELLGVESHQRRAELLGHPRALERGRDPRGRLLDPLQPRKPLALAEGHAQALDLVPVRLGRIGRDGVVQVLERVRGMQVRRERAELEQIATRRGGRAQECLEAHNC